MRFTRAVFDTYFKHFPKKYIDREKGILPERTYENRFGGPTQYQYKLKPEVYIASEARPWERENKMLNKGMMQQDKNWKAMWKTPRKERYLEIENVPEYERVFTEPIPDEEWLFFRGDRVEILVGKDKGKQGFINYVVRERNWVFVEGLNTHYIWQMKSNKFPGLSYLKERPLSVALNEVALLDPTDLKPVKFEWRYTENGERVRVSIRSGQEISMPDKALETYEYATPANYPENKDKDTKEDDMKASFKASNRLFEEEINDEMGIVETRKPGKTFWYKIPMAQIDYPKVNTELPPKRHSAAVKHLSEFDQKVSGIPWEKINFLNGIRYDSGKPYG